MKYIEWDHPNHPKDKQNYTHSYNPFPNRVRAEKGEECSRNRKIQTITMVDGYCPSPPEPLVFNGIIAKNSCVFHKQHDIFIAAHSDKPYCRPAQSLLTLIGPEAIKH